MSLAVLPTRVAGFRVTRALARDDRADLLLVRDDGSVALVAKVFRPGVERAAVDRELAALARGAHRHVLPLLDAGCTSDGAVVGILRHLPCGSLARWLEGRELVSAGEAVTILAPLADAVRTLHGRGVAHGRLASSRVLFDADGAPVLTGFGAAVLFGSDAPPVLRERIPEVAADLDALRGIADAVLGHVTGAGARRAAELRADLAGVPTDEVAALLVDGLFSFAAGSPIRFADSGADLPASAAARAPTVAAAHEVAEPDRRRPSPRVPAGQPVAVLLERGPVSVAASALRARWRSIDAGRRRIVVGLVAASAAAAVAMVLVPSGAGGSSRADESPEGALAPAPASSPRVTPTEAPAAPGGAGSGDPARGSSPSATDSAGSRVRDPDPLVALPVLLRTRDRCLRDQDPRCLIAVDEPGSPAAVVDTAAIAAGSAPVLSAAGARTVQLLGGVTIIETGDPPVRIALIRRADGGWRLRDLPTAAVG